MSPATPSDGAEALGGVDALSHLLPDWDQLQAGHPTSSPFQSAGWLAAHACAYGVDDLVTVAVPGGGALAAAAAFRRARRGPARVLTAATQRVSDFDDVVLGPSDGAARRLVEALLAVPGWDVLRFPEVPPSADLWRLLPSWPGRVLRLPAADCVVMDGEGLADYAVGLPRSKRKQLAQEQRGLVRAGVHWVPAEGDPESAVRTLLDLHQLSWAGRPMTAEHATDRFRTLLCEAVQRLGPRREAVVLQFVQHGRVRGSALCLNGPQYVGAYLTGHHPDLRRQVSLHTLETVAMFELAAELGVRSLHLLRGDEPYKLRFPARRERNEQVLLLRPASAAGMAFAAGLSGRRRAAGVARAGRGRLAAWRAPEPERRT